MLKYRQPRPMPPVRQRMRDLFFDLFIAGIVAIIAVIGVVFFWGVLYPR